MNVRDILESCLYVDDLEAAEQFYRKVLGLKFVSRQEGRHVFFRCSDRMLLLFNAAESNDPDGDLPPHGTTGAGHLAFAAGEAELDRWKQHLIANGVDIESEIEWPNGFHSFYFRDPAGNSLEFATPMIWGIEENAVIKDGNC